MTLKSVLSAVLLMLVFMLSSVSAEVEIAIDGKFDDWADVPVLIEDPDDVGEDNGDIREIRVHTTENTFYAMMTVYGMAAPADAQRYYYHFLIDADNDLKTGFDNAMYEGVETGVKNSIGADFYVQIGRRSGADDGIEVHFLTANSDDAVAQDFSWATGGDSLEAEVPFDMFITLQNIGEIFQKNQTIMIAAFQEGSANDWEVDWTEPAEHIVGVPIAVTPADKVSATWGMLKK